MSRIDTDVVEQVATEIISLAEQGARQGDSLALQAKDCLLTGRLDDAADIVIPALLDGKASSQMQKVGAFLYYFAAVKKEAGRPRIPRPRMWEEIGRSYQWLRKDKVKWDDAIPRIMKEFGMKRTAVVNAVLFSLAVEKKIDEILEDDTSE